MADPRVIVVGGGLSGLSALHTLYQRGANVLILDKQGFWGGNSTKATSGINGAGTNTQQEKGIQDSAKIFFDDTKRSARDLARDDLIKVLTGRSGEAINWLQDYFNLDLTKVSRLGGHTQPRTHRGNAQFPGMMITYALMDKADTLAEDEPQRVQALRKARVTRLLQDDSGAVTGVEFEHEGETKTAYGPVILATGGYAADFSKEGLLAKHRPDTLPLSTTNGEHCTGDGQKMCMAIGANTVDLEKVQVHPTGLVDPNEPDAKTKFLAAEALRGVGGLLLDNEGNRFADELGHRDYVTGRMWDNNKFPVRLILNSSSSKEIEWHCKHYTGRGLMKHIKGFKGLAEEMGLSEDKIKSTYDDYAAIAQGKKKDPFGKKYFDNWKTSPDDTFYVAQMMPVLHYTGGVQIDEDSRVIDQQGKPIPGLWASGELGGGVHGANRLGGSSLLGCVVFGRVAGDDAAQYLFKAMSSGATGGSIANQRLTQIKNQLETKIKIDPEAKHVTLTFSWGDEGASSTSSSDSAPTGPSQPTLGDGKTIAQPDAPEASSSPKTPKQPDPKQLKEYTLEDVAAHKSKDDIWVVVNGEVLDVTNFLPDHPGGPKAIELYAGRDATEEFNMLHDPKVVKKYAPSTIIGTLKK